MPPAQQPVPQQRGQRFLSDGLFYVVLSIFGGAYLSLLVGMLLADVVYITDSDRTSTTASSIIVNALADPKIQYSIKLTLVSCLFSAILSLLVAVPTGYVLSRFRFFGRNLLDAILDIPIVLPPLVVGLSLLVLFQFWPYSLINRQVQFQIPGVVLAQFMVAAAFAIRVMRAAFDQIDTRLEKVALTLGCSRAEAFGLVVLPQARQGMLTAATLAWARALGEFGPLLIFAGATRNKTEVLSTTVWLEFSVGNIQGAVAVSLFMVAIAVVVLVVARVWGSRTLAI